MSIQEKLIPPIVFFAVMATLFGVAFGGYHLNERALDSAYGGRSEITCDPPNGHAYYCCEGFKSIAEKEGVPVPWSWVYSGRRLIGYLYLKAHWPDGRESEVFYVDTDGEPVRMVLRPKK